MFGEVPLLAVRDLSVSYGAIDAVKGVSFEVPEGGVTCLLGPNGAGKTTTLYALAGVLRARGRIELGGEDISARSPEHRVRAGLVLVPEGRLLFSEMTVMDNLLAGAYLRLGRRRAGAGDELDRVMELLPRLAERRVQLAGTLSGGEQQMLAIARALMARPRLLMLDEPSMGLAPLVIEEIMEIIRELNAQGTTILLVEQNIRLPLELGQRLHVLQSGRVVYTGSRTEIGEEELLDVLHRAYLGAL
ncbi:MAG TPA: ABC transporter ATP-binding protein [Acidimicrobiia bacterium]|nr:ABC transporter ATP-binding protein [Acidimicrobiia bacterium]